MCCCSHCLIAAVTGAQSPQPPAEAALREVNAWRAVVAMVALPAQLLRAAIARTRS